MSLWRLAPLHVTLDNDHLDAAVLLAVFRRIVGDDGILLTEALGVEPFAVDSV